MKNYQSIIIHITILSVFPIHKFIPVWQTICFHEFFNRPIFEADRYQGTYLLKLLSNISINFQKTLNEVIAEL